jgi:hypothetical protein
MEMTKDELKKILFTGRTNVFALLDGASIKDLRMQLFKTDAPNYCLFRGELAPDVAEAAPYLVGLLRDSPFTEWLLSESIGKHWGVFALTRQSITEMRRHFRSLITVHDESGKPMIFRYYDPRVLRNFLPTCNGGELKTFFGKVDTFVAEDVDGVGISTFELADNELKITLLN